MTNNSYKALLKRVVRTPRIGTGEPCIRDTRIQVTVILDSLAEGLTPAQIVEHYPPLTQKDVRAAVAYAAELLRAVSVSQDKLGSLERLRGLLKFPSGPPTDDEVKDMITDYLAEKYS
jgi:uncharacterized protein (DUF433 family)